MSAAAIIVARARARRICASGHRNRARNRRYRRRRNRRCCRCLQTINCFFFVRNLDRRRATSAHASIFGQ